MTLFRFHKGGLEESMNTVVEVDDLTHLKELISKKWKIECVRLEIQHYGYDERIEWDTYIVKATFAKGPSLKKQESFPVGFTNGDIKK